MNSPLVLLLVITILFILLLILKSALKLRFCVICASVSLTWLGFLFWHWFVEQGDVLLLALLMGQSIIGLCYLVEKKVPDHYQLFRLPFLLSLTAIGIILLGFLTNLFQIFLFLIILWIITGLLYLYRQNPRMHKIIQHIIACCKNW